jgi:integrase/recombinase XerC/integrase/recombinase XerD
MHPPKVPKELIKPFTTQNIEDMLTLCDNSFLGFRNRAIILTFLDSGLRLSELANIQLNDIDFERETIRVMGKGSKERIVRIGKQTQKAVLKYLLQRNDGLGCLWVTEERRPLHRWGIQTMIIRLGKRAGMVNVRCSPHTFRHTFAIMALQNGIGEFNLQWLLGHSTLTQTRRYCGTLGATEAISAHKKAGPVDSMKF